jgi:hypothetical protein
VFGTSALDYQKTETRLNIPRLDYSNGTCPSLLVEPQRTNLVLYSSSFDNAYWTKSGATITANTTISPSGIQDADFLVESAANERHTVTMSNTIVAAVAHSASVFVKANGRTKFALSEEIATGIYASFDLTTGVVLDQSGISANIENVGNGWFRCDYTMNSTTFFMLRICLLPNSYVSGSVSGTYLGDGTSGVYLWGAQLEAGSYPTSYIPTTSASVTRNADVISKTGISSLIGQSEGSVFLDLYATGQNSDSNPGFSLLASVGNTNRVEIYTNNGVLGFIIYSPSATVVLSTYTIVPNERIRVALAYQSGATSLFVNGAQVASSAVTFSLSGLNDFILNKSLIGDLQAENSYNAAALWKTRLTNDELERLTGTGFNTYAEMANYYNYITQ